jgi:hypothetical protein
MSVGMRLRGAQCGPAMERNILTATKFASSWKRGMMVPAIGPRFASALLRPDVLHSFEEKVDAHPWNRCLKG